MGECIFCGTNMTAKYSDFAGTININSGLHVTMHNK
jgi:hypothetical protein